MARQEADSGSGSAGGARHGALYALAAWIVPGAGHFLLGRHKRAALFAVLVLTSLAIGVALDGLLYRPTAGQPLATLASFACMAMGIPYAVLRWGMEYQGDWAAAGFEYGKAFILTAGLMNVLLILDAWDIAAGEKD